MKKFEELPENLQNPEVKKYHTLLEKRKTSLLLKSVFDRVAAFFLLILIAPVLIILGIWIKLDSKGPVFYRQERITTYGRKFRIFKFRTMVVDADKKGSLVTLKNDNRITKVGSFIRKSRLDELPQVINILLGDMSFVGTRPEVEKYTSQYTDEMKATLLMPAGVTSIASIEYKDEDAIISQYVSDTMSVDEVYVQKVLPEKMKYNLEYIKNFGFFNDLKIMLDTALKVLK